MEMAIAETGMAMAIAETVMATQATEMEMATETATATPARIFGRFCATSPVGPRPDRSTAASSRMRTTSLLGKPRSNVPSKRSR